MLLAIASMLLATVAGESTDPDTIEVTLPVGVNLNDPDAPEIINELIAGDPSSRSEIASVPTPPPSLPEVSKQKTKFRQEFRVESQLGKEFHKDELDLFKALYQRYTVDFSSLAESEVESKITTTCEVRNQYFRYEDPGDRRRLVESPQLRRRLQDDQLVIMVDFSMTYESRHYDVTEYPKLFQNWINNNANFVLTQLQTLGLRVLEVGSLKRIVISSSTPVPSMAPSPSWISGEGPYAIPAEEPFAYYDTNVTIPPPVRTETTSSSAISRGAISLTAILGFVGLLLLIGICVFIFLFSRNCRRRTVVSRTNAGATGNDAATKNIEMLQRQQTAANPNFDAATMATVATSVSSYPADTMSSPPPMIADFSSPPPSAFP